MKKKTNNQFVTSISQLKKLITEKHTSFAILLAGGNVYSRKTITINKKTQKFLVFNHIDDSTQRFTENELFNHKLTNIGKAMKLKALIALID